MQSAENTVKLPLLVKANSTLPVFPTLISSILDANTNICARIRNSPKLGLKGAKQIG